MTDTPKAQEGLVGFRRYMPPPAPPPPATGVCECGDPSAASCASCIVADYQAQHPSCTTCCPLPYREAATPPARAALAAQEGK